MAMVLSQVPVQKLQRYRRSMVSSLPTVLRVPERYPGAQSLPLGLLLNPALARKVASWL